MASDPIDRTRTLKDPTRTIGAAVYVGAEVPTRGRKRYCSTVGRFNFRGQAFSALRPGVRFCVARTAFIQTLTH
jgi:hypothetical protein